MTEQELNRRIAEILESTEAENGCGRRSGRQYRRLQRVKHMDHLLFLIQHCGYAPNIGYIMGGLREANDLAPFWAAHSIHEVQQSSTVSQTEGKSHGPQVSWPTKEGQSVPQSFRILVDALLNKKRSRLGHL